MPLTKFLYYFVLSSESVLFAYYWSWKSETSNSYQRQGILDAKTLIIPHFTFSGCKVNCYIILKLAIRPFLRTLF